MRVAAWCQQKILCCKLMTSCFLFLLDDGRDDLTGFFFGCSRNFSVLIAFLETDVFESVLLHAGFHKPPRKIITFLLPKVFLLSHHDNDVFVDDDA